VLNNAQGMTRQLPIDRQEGSTKISLSQLDDDFVASSQYFAYHQTCKRVLIWILAQKWARANFLMDAVRWWQLSEQCLSRELRAPVATIAVNIKLDAAISAE